jgi:hypothetical protein
MGLMAVPSADIQRQARREFVGKGDVVGVGVSSEQKLMFLLKQESPESKTMIEQWAKQRQLNIEFLVVGEDLLS